MRPPALALLGLACGAALSPACKDKAPGGAAPRPVAPDQIEGTLTLDGKPLEIAMCRPGREGTLYVDLVTGVGALRFVGGEAERMYWNPRAEANERGAPIACSIPHRSWGGGTRVEDGTSYFRGELAFTCAGGAGAVGALAGKVSLDCGNISPLERKLLDESRRRKREELYPADPADPAKPPAAKP
jgi:hypothetical protein